MGSDRQGVSIRNRRGNASLADLFRGRSQLLIYHFMFGPDYTAGRPSCSAIADGFNGSVVHLANHDVTLCAVSRAPLAKLQVYKQRMGWSFPWASSFGGDFNPDWGSVPRGATARSRRLQLPTRESVAVAQQRRTRRRDCGWTQGRRGNLHAREAGYERLRDRGRCHLSPYSTYARGLDGLWGVCPVARPRTEGTQRDRCLVAPPRRVQGLSEVVAIAAHCATGDHDV